MSAAIPWHRATSPPDTVAVGGYGAAFVSTWVVPALHDGVLALPTGGGGMALLGRDDAARALAAAALVRRQGILS